MHWGWQLFINHCYVQEVLLWVHSLCSPECYNQPGKRRVASNYHTKPVCCFHQCCSYWCMDVNKNSNALSISTSRLEPYLHHHHHHPPSPIRIQEKVRENKESSSQEKFKEVNSSGLLLQDVINSTKCSRVVNIKIQKNPYPVRAV